jgi:hypothetical protein
MRISGTYSASWILNLPSENPRKPMLASSESMFAIFCVGPGASEKGLDSGSHTASESRLTL